MALDASECLDVAAAVREAFKQHAASKRYSENASRERYGNHRKNLNSVLETNPERVLGEQVIAALGRAGFEVRRG